MKTFIAPTLLTFFALACQAAPPTDESIAVLLEVTRTESLAESMFSNMEQAVRQGMTQATAGKPLNDEQKRVLEAAPARIVAVMRDQLNWSSMKPIYISIYRESFEQSEIDGLIAFYKSPVGKSFVDKMPTVMQKSMVAMQSQMQQFGPKLQDAMKKTLEEAKIPK